MNTTQERPLSEIETDTEITTKEAAALLGFCPGSVRKLLIHGKIEGVNDERGHWRISRRSVLEYKSGPAGRPSDGLASEIIPDDADLIGVYMGKVLPALRERGMTVLSFVEQMGIDYSLVYRVDSGDRDATPAYRYRAARIIGAPLAELFVKVYP